MKKHIPMDDQCDSQKIEGDKQQDDSYRISQRDKLDACYVLPTTWLRRIIQVGDGYNWLVLGCRYNFLWNFRFFLVILYFTYEITK